MVLRKNQFTRSVVPTSSALHSTDGLPRLIAITAYLPSSAKRNVIFIVIIKQILVTSLVDLLEMRWCDTISWSWTWRVSLLRREQKTELFLLSCHIDHFTIISTPPTRNVTSQRLTKKFNYKTLWIRHVVCISLTF